MPTLNPYFGKILTPGHRRANTSINLTGAVADSDLFRYRELSCLSVSQSEGWTSVTISQSEGWTSLTYQSE